LEAELQQPAELEEAIPSSRTTRGVDNSSKYSELMPKRAQKELAQKVIESENRSAHCDEVICIMVVSN